MTLPFFFLLLNIYHKAFIKISIERGEKSLKIFTEFTREEGDLRELKSSTREGEKN